MTSLIIFLYYVSYSHCKERIYSHRRWLVGRNIPVIKNIKLNNTAFQNFFCKRRIDKHYLLLFCTDYFYPSEQKNSLKSIPELLHQTQQHMEDYVPFFCVVFTFLSHHNFTLPFFYILTLFWTSSTKHYQTPFDIFYPAPNKPFKLTPSCLFLYILFAKTIEPLAKYSTDSTSLPHTSACEDWQFGEINIRIFMICRVKFFKIICFQRITTWIYDYCISQDISLTTL